MLLELKFHIYRGVTTTHLQSMRYSKQFEPLAELRQNVSLWEKHSGESDSDRKL